MRASETIRRFKPSTGKMATRLLVSASAVSAILGVSRYLAFRLSPWPSSLLVRRNLEKGAEKTSQALLKHVPSGVSERLDEHYDPKDPDAYLDVFYPSKIESGERALQTIVWVHGGWISGTKNQIANYAKILASKGCTVVSVNYSVAPEATYPTPLRQVNAALSYLVENAHRLHVDPSRFVLAGDSGGAQIAAQLANAICEPSYAAALGIVPSIKRSQLRCVMLYCGAYDPRKINPREPSVRYMKNALWAYSGSRNFMKDPRFTTASVINYVTENFPPTFISAGNGDPLLAQSQAFAGALAGFGVAVDSLFFHGDHTPVLPQDYQFDLDTEAGRLALERSLKFLSVYQ